MIALSPLWSCVINFRSIFVRAYIPEHDTVLYSSWILHLYYFLQLIYDYCYDSKINFVVGVAAFLTVSSNGHLLLTKEIYISETQDHSYINEGLCFPLICI